MTEFLKSSWFNQWRLYWLVAMPICLVMLIAMAQVESWDALAVSSMIQLSVRWAVPWLYLAFAASSLLLLFPSAWTRWLMRNRKIMGLCFATAMAWQGFFILWLTTVYREYYIAEVYVLRDAIEGTVGYLFLAAMTVTSFSFGRRRMSPRAWRWLHKAGIYFLWAYAYTVYWWNLFYYSGPIWLDYVYYLAGFVACALRSLAWRKKRLEKMQRGSGAVIVPAVFRLAGWTLVSTGVVVAFLTPMWRQLSEDVLTGYALTAFPEKYIPYWPFEPFIPLLIIALGAWMTSWVRPVEMRVDPGSSPG
jgi:hypothetical protein